MARTPPPPPHPYEEEEAIVEEEYIDMDVSSATLVCYTVSSPPPHSRDFEFQMSAKPTLPEMDGIASPADELFYKGKLLPLHLPPRLQLVQKLLLQDSKAPTHFAHSTNVPTTTASASATTPYESCNVSPATSCYVSGELNPEDYYSDNDEFECRRKERTSTNKYSSWTKKLKHNSSSLRSLKLLKASRAYLKSLFTKSPGCSEESCAPAHAKVATKKIKSMTSGDVKRGANSSALLSRRVDAEKMVVEEGHGHRRSFSGAMIKRCVALPNKSSSSSSSSTSTSSSNSSSFSSLNSNNGLAALKRSSSVNSEDVECSIQGAIAYCKKSSQQDRSSL